MSTLLLLLACRPDPGSPTYPDPSAVDTADTGENDDFYDGPDPWEEGEARLSLGAFYEGGASEVLPVDDVTRHYYIYSGTYTQTVDVIVHGGGDWWGGGITWDSPEDLSGWSTLHVSVKASTESFATLDLHLNGGGVEATVAATSYGFSSDGEWHHLAVPLADFVSGGANLSSVVGPFILIGTAGTAGDELRVDNLYLSGS